MQGLQSGIFISIVSFAIINAMWIQIWQWIFFFFKLFLFVNISKVFNWASISYLLISQNCKNLLTGLFPTSHPIECFHVSLPTRTSAQKSPLIAHCLKITSALVWLLRCSLTVWLLPICTTLLALTKWILFTATRTHYIFLCFCFQSPCPSFIFSSKPCTFKTLCSLSLNSPSWMMQSPVMISPLKFKLYYVNHKSLTEI